MDRRLPPLGSIEAADPGLEFTDPEREAISIVRGVLTRMADKERDAR
jgi:hypothetical protein